jgi:hypothetical protein
MHELLAALLTLAIIALGFRIMFRGIFGPSRGAYRTGRGWRGPSYLHAFLFSVLLPAVWWTLTLLGRLYQRAYVVFTEFLTGVPDWVSLRTSLFKYLGATMAFLAYNGAILLALTLVVGNVGPEAAGVWSLLAVGIAGLVVAFGARTCMRRAP